MTLDYDNILWPNFTSEKIQQRFIYWTAAGCAAPKWTQTNAFWTISDYNYFISYFGLEVCEKYIIRKSKPESKRTICGNEIFTIINI